MHVVPFANLRAEGASLKVHRCGHPITQCKLVAERSRPVEMRVDETGRHHETLGVDRLLASNPVLGDRGDLAAPDADIGNGVMLGLRVHDPTTYNDKIEISRRALRCPHGGSRRGLCYPRGRKYDGCNYCSRQSNSGGVEFSADKHLVGHAIPPLELWLPLGLCWQTVLLGKLSGN